MFIKFTNTQQGTFLLDLIECTIKPVPYQKEWSLILSQGIEVGILYTNNSIRILDDSFANTLTTELLRLARLGADTTKEN